MASKRARPGELMEACRKLLRGGLPDAPLGFAEAAKQCVCKNYKQGFYHNKDADKMYGGFGKAFEEAFGTPEESGLNFSSWQHFDTAENFKEKFWIEPGFDEPATKKRTHFLDGLWDSATKKGSLSALRDKLHEQGNVWANVPHEEVNLLEVCVCVRVCVRVCVCVCVCVCV